MAVVISSYGALTAIASSSSSPTLSSTMMSGPFYDGYRRTYGQLYKAQPAVRTVIDFFARNIAQLGLQVFERRADNDRVRLYDHDLARVFRRPNPSTSRYRFIESTVQELGVYASAYWLKVRAAREFGLVRLPAGEMRVAGGLIPSEYVWEPASGAAPRPFRPADIVHFRMFDPENPLLGFPPLETLRRVLAEEAASAEYRRYFWKNAARTESVITRPAGARWSPEQKEDFRRQWQQFAGSKAGMTPILEDGMELKPFGFNAKDSQYIEARKLSREEVAAAYHVPLPMVGILDHATFSNIREQHKQLYQDCLGPWLTMLEEDIELQLLPDFDEPERVYVEFNIAEKLKGSFEEQAVSLQAAVGRPYMTANEARARLNLPRDPDPKSDKIAEVAPGQATTKPAAAPERTLREALTSHATRQSARIGKDAPEERADKFNAARWQQELAADLAPVLGEARGGELAARVTRETHALLVAGELAWTPARIEAVLAEELAHA